MPVENRTTFQRQPLREGIRAYWTWELQVTACVNLPVRRCVGAYVYMLGVVLIVSVLVSVRNTKRSFQSVYENYSYL